jgi:hypothetical protein
MADLRRLWEAYQKGGEDNVEDLGNIFEYGLAFDYVEPGTFNGQRRGYFRYQLSTGGPGDEFRFYCDERLAPVKVEYWFLDWFDGAKVTPQGKNLALLLELWGWFKDGEAVEQAMKDAGC